MSPFLVARFSSVCSVCASLTNISVPAVAAFGLVNCSLSVARFVSDLLRRKGVDELNCHVTGINDCFKRDPLNSAIFCDQYV